MCERTAGAGQGAGLAPLVRSDSFCSAWFICWLLWACVAACGPALVVSGALSFARSCLPAAMVSLLWSTCSGREGSVGAAHGLGCPMAGGVFLDQGSSLCPLHWQGDS